MSRQRQHHTPEQKVAILRRHLLEKVPVSSLCEEHQIHPAVLVGAGRLEGRRPLLKEDLLPLVNAWAVCLMVPRTSPVLQMWRRLCAPRCASSESAVPTGVLALVTRANLKLFAHGPLRVYRQLGIDYLVFQATSGHAFRRGRISELEVCGRVREAPLG